MSPLVKDSTKNPEFTGYILGPLAQMLIGFYRLLIFPMG